MDQKLIAVLGSGKCLPGESTYEQARMLAKALTESGYAIINGGYKGVMEASARGALESAKGNPRVIGVVIKQKPQGNKFLTETRVVNDFFDRLREIMSADAFILFSGGAGTICELSTISVLQAKLWKKEKPIIILEDNLEWYVFEDMLGIDSINIRPRGQNPIQKVVDHLKRLF